MSNIVSTQHRLGYLSTLRKYDPPPIARTNGRSEAHEGAFERSQQDLSDVHSKFVLKGQASGQGQVKGHNLGSPLRRPQRPSRC